MITPDMLPGADGENINGPSLIRAPAWLKQPLGRYYLYFAHHNGSYIRLATADQLDGPWIIRSVLDLSQVPQCHGHLASPDVHVDEETQTIRMYFHGAVVGQRVQQSYVALSVDGVNFHTNSEVLGPAYFRVFRNAGFWFAMAKGGRLFRSSDGLTNFEQGEDTFPLLPKNPRYSRRGSVRHVAVDLMGGAAYVYFSRIGDRPERIIRARISLDGPWLKWRAKEFKEIVRPEFAWEGSTLPLRRSRAGRARGSVRELRDPCIFGDNGAKYLLYSIAGEQGIAIAEIKSPLC